MPMFQPDPASLARHGLPDWFQDAKLGVMITWGLYSVPAFAPNHGEVTALLRDRPDEALALTPYAEWYENSLKFPDGETAAYHREHFGDRPYADLRQEFEAGLKSWSPDPLMDQIAGAGAKYIVPITSHSDSYALWPTATVNPLHGEGWHCGRDVIGAMVAAARARGLRIGLYSCPGLDWSFRPEPIANLGEMLASVPSGPEMTAYAVARYHELIERYDPDYLWNDIAFPDAEALWPLLAEFYNGRPDRMINDRFQPFGEVNRQMAASAEARHAFNHGLAEQLSHPGFAFAPGEPPVWDVRTPEYAGLEGVGGQPFEVVRGIGTSFGYKANDPHDAHLSGAELIRDFVRIVGQGGNLLIGLGPKADGSLPPEQAQPLAELGAWLSRHGEAIYGTRSHGKVEASAEAFLVEAGARRRLLVPEVPADGTISAPGMGLDRRGLEPGTASVIAL